MSSLEKIKLGVYLPNELTGYILFNFTKYNMHCKNILYSVSRNFLEIMKNDVCNKWAKIMNLKIDILVTIAEFIERSDEDSIPYLWGPLLITDFRYYDIQTLIPKLSNEVDRYGSKRLFDTVILSDIKMGMHFGPGLIDIDTNYFSKIKYFRNKENILVENVFTEEDRYNYNETVYGTTAKPPVSNIENNKISDKDFISHYWIYIFEEQCHYCKSYSYFILPYYDNSINSNKGSLLYDVYYIVYNKFMEIEEPCDYPIDKYPIDEY